MNTFITAQGFAKISMLTTIIGAVINIVLDPILIFGLGMGVKGAAIATVLSQAVGAIWVIRFLTGPEMLAAGHAENLTRLHNELIHKDWFQTLPDFNAYVVRKGQALSDYACDPKGWRRKCLVNIAKAGMFSSDRTIAEYDRDIWHLGK